MARSTPERKALRSLVWLLVIIVGLLSANAASVAFNEGEWTPRLALDLQGGTQLILEPQIEEGANVSAEQLNQAVAIIRQRVDAGGVSEAEINTQGGRNIVVSIPGTPDQATIDRIQSAAKLEFRPVLAADAASNSAIGGPDDDVSDESGIDDGQTEGGAEDGAATDDTTTGEATAEDNAAAVTTDAPEAPPIAPTDASDLAWITPEVRELFDTIDCAALDELGTNIAPVDEPLVTCDVDGIVKYILGPVEVEGASITNATAGLIASQTGVTTTEWGVNIEFDAVGTQQFRTVTERLITLQGIQNQFAIVLDGSVISAPRTLAAITNGQPQISGSFTQDTAQVLADQLRFGALPIGFELQSQENISATLGISQLESGIIAGVIGLLLVMAYALFQYRALGGVIIVSLMVAAVLSYFVILYLSNQQGYRLSLAGVAGLIISIGVIADGFIVYFERVRDELRDGRSLPNAVEAGWSRAFRTILISNVVSLVGAVVLYVLAVGNVRGFAFTLGVMSLINLVIVTLMTYPTLRLVARTDFFSSGHPLSGLDPKALGAVYRGRAQFRAPVSTPKKNTGSSREAQRRQTIAERKAAEAETAGKKDAR
ncbi:preprotein translocase subunit SecD [Microcella alkaliphila]|uniref:Protein translocase subunit SecD n=1 Tax=Microcella alkaliphila TaxID=279828 RepID=A0A4Q7TT82_9MICO|nr:protein translocase subunit SecD [Microcella alkaliphila]RZT64211.1 preprotein translocase subunit SecD [Microcella alkaliphila]